uniref:Uncharacterized protein n=1 Tax=Manihot esculenta TaxID=3983 RepID=A0A251L2M0_MANES
MVLLSTRHKNHVNQGNKIAADSTVKVQNLSVYENCWFIKFRGIFISCTCDLLDGSFLRVLLQIRG